MKQSKILIAILIIMFLFLLGPFLIIFISSFSGDATMKFPPKGFSTEWFAKVISIKMFRTTFWVSLKIGLAATAAALVMGIPVAYASVRYKYPGKAAVDVFFSSPAIVPGLVIGFALLRYFIYIAGLPIVTGLFLGHTAILFPYTVRVVSASLKNFDPAVEEAAVSLGSSPLHSFFRGGAAQYPVGDRSGLYSGLYHLLQQRPDLPLSDGTRCGHAAHSDAGVHGVLLRSHHIRPVQHSDHTDHTDRSNRREGPGHHKIHVEGIPG